MARLGSDIAPPLRLYLPHRAAHIGNPPETDEWLDNDAVCRRLNISPRTLQTLRDTGKIPFSMVGHKYYYKACDISELLNSKAE